MIDTHAFAIFLYNLTLLPVIFFSVLFFLLAFINIFATKKPAQKFARLAELPFISVQIPTYNDPVAVRCIRQCMQFDYPEDKFEIIIADDSTNKKTQKTLRKFAQAHPSWIKYIHRNNRQGFKPGALKNAMKFTRGEIIVVFDSDWIPQKNFLRKIVRPFSDPKVAIVQASQGIYNKNKNSITRFAAYLLTVYHSIIMPINNRINCVFFCGTAGAIRRSAFDEVGGWNLDSLTEDSDLSVRLLFAGYRTIYLDIIVPSEVPDTFEGFVKQQMRWCYGNARVFFDNAAKILFGRGISLRQRLMIVFITLGNFTAPVVVLMTVFGFAGWFLGDPTLFTTSDLMTFIVKFTYTSGFLAIGTLALYKKKLLGDFPLFLLTAMTVGLVLSVANSIAFARAIFNRKLSWFCTPKATNSKFI